MLGSFLAFSLFGRCDRTPLPYLSYTIKECKVSTMNERLVEFVAQTISAMSDEECQLLDDMLDANNTRTSLRNIPIPVESAPVVESPPTESKVLVHSGTEVRIKDTDERSTALSQRLPENNQAIDKSTSEDKNSSAHQESLRSFFAQIRSFQIEGPEDWSSRLDAYMHEDAIAEHE